MQNQEEMRLTFINSELDINTILIKIEVFSFFSHFYNFHPPKVNIGDLANQVTGS